ncbi:Hamartin [Dirofilaria immitis]|nr:Hamartin [Dirofilaria immitis]
MSSSTMSYVSQLPDLNDLFLTQTDSSSSNSLGMSLDHWNEDGAWLEFGKNNLDILPDSKSDSLDNRTSDIIISFSTGDTRRATAGAADSKHIRRFSLTQKFNDFIRRRKSRALSDEPLLHNLSLPSTLLVATADRTISDEPIEEIFVPEDIQKRSEEMGNIEEGVDAREICSPSILFLPMQPSEDSFANTPATIVPLENMHQLECEAYAPNTFRNHEAEIFSVNSTTNTSFTKSFQQGVDSDDNTEVIRYRKTKEFKMNEAETPNESISNDSANRFSLSDNAKISSFNDLKQRQSIIAKNMEISAEDIEELIAQKCPYLPFLQALPFSLIDEENLNEELKCEHERTYQNYIEASADYHTCLKQLSLADRLPATIYDDVSEQLKGLPAETQIKVLNARLALVNQHLLYERCGRLLHAERNRRLFGRLKQQKSLESEKMSLHMALRNAQIASFLDEREQLINALTDLRKRSNMERSKRREIEKKYCEKIKTYRDEADRYLTILTHLELKMESMAESNSHWQVELEMYKRRSEDTEMKLLFAESKLEGIEALKIELKNAHQINQQLRDEVSLLQKQLEVENSRSKSRLRSMELDTSQAMAEVVRLKNLLVHEEREKESIKAKARKFEDELMIEKRRCTEFNTLFERAKRKNFPSELFAEVNENDKDTSNIYVSDGSTIASLPKNDFKDGVLSLFS